MVKPMEMHSMAVTHSSPSITPQAASSSAGREAGREMPQPSGSSAAKSSMGAARSRLPISFWAVMRA